MPFNNSIINKQIEDVICKCSLTSPHNYDDFSDLPGEKVSEAVNLLFAAIQRLAPPNSSYVKNTKPYEEHLSGTIGRALSPLIGILKALQSDYNSGNLQTVQELIHADLFADFLEMAEYLLTQGYKDPAAVIAGSVLEEHLRKLCLKSDLQIVQHSGSPKKADSLNAELAGTGIYTNLDQKSVTAWLDLRNKAAHGNYADYTKEQVVLTVQSVRDFLIRHPA